MVFYDFCATEKTGVWPGTATQMGGGYGRWLGGGGVGGETNEEQLKNGGTEAGLGEEGRRGMQGS